jgi:hypothetical protein
MWQPQMRCRQSSMMSSGRWGPLIDAAGGKYRKRVSKVQRIGGHANCVDTSTYSSGDCATLSLELPKASAKLASMAKKHRRILFPLTHLIDCGVPKDQILDLACGSMDKVRT